MWKLRPSVVDFSFVLFLVVVAMMQVPGSGRPVAAAAARVQLAVGTRPAADGPNAVGQSHLRRSARPGLAPDRSLPGPSQHHPLRLRRRQKGPFLNYVEYSEKWHFFFSLFALCVVAGCSERGYSKKLHNVSISCTDWLRIRNHICIMWLPIVMASTRGKWILVYFRTKICIKLSRNVFLWAALIGQE